MKIKKVLWSIILGVYIASDVLSHLWYINWNVAEAWTSWSSMSPLVAVLIDNDTYNSIGWNSNFTWYTDTYIPEKYPDSQAIIYSLDTNEYTAPEIVKLLENTYFDGIKNTDSRLIWVIVMWKIPLPVVKYQNYIFPSIYPYTDFIEQKYIWNEAEGYFTLNKSVWQAELWHWLISFDDTSKYDDFFKKLKKYQANPKKFIDKKIWYDDFIALNKNFLTEIYLLYKNKIIFAEDLMYHRYTNFLVNMMQLDQQNTNAEVLWDLQEKMAALNINIPAVQSAKETLLENKTEFTPTLLLQNKLQSFLKDYHESISTILLKTVDDNIKASDRWTVNDSHYQKIQLKDQILLWNDEAKGILRSINDKLEEYVDQKIAKEKYAMKTTIPIYYQRRKDKKKRFLFIKRYVPEYKDTYEFYYFWQNASTITNAEEFSIFRGTYRNLEDFVNYSTIINDSLNPAKSSYDKTNLTKKWIGSSYDLFSTQVEANRGYNILNMETEYDTYNKEKRHAELEEKCKKYWFWIKLFWCREREWRPKWTCIKWSTKTDDIADCETFIDFGNRVWWGWTPLNLDMEQYQDQIYKFSWKYEYRDAIKPIFDIAWSVKLSSPQPKATSYEGSTEYISPILMADKWGSLIRTDLHTAYTDARYFKLPLSLVNNKNFKVNGPNQFTIKKEKRWKTDEELTYIYNIIPSEIKHDASTELQINWYYWPRYWTGTETYWYYRSIMKALDAAKDEGYSSQLNTSMLNVKITINNLSTKVNWTPNYTIWADTWEILSGINALNPELLKTLLNIATQTSWQMENWEKFNAIFGNNYWATVESYIEWYSQHQIELNKKIDIRSKRYNEIIAKITDVAKEIESKRSIAKTIFNNYNAIFTIIEWVNKTVDDKIAELQKIIDEKTKENEELSWANAELSAENAELAEQNSSLTETNSNLTNDNIRLASEKTRLEWEKWIINWKIDTAKSERDTLQAQFDEQKDEYNSWVNKINSLNSEKSTLNTQITNWWISNISLTDSNKKLKKEKEELEAEKTRLSKLNWAWLYTDKITQIEKQITAIQEKIDKNKETIDSNNEKINENKDKIKTIEEEIKNIENIIKPIQEIKDKLKTKEDEISNYQNELIRIDNEIKGIDTQVSSNISTMNNNTNQMWANANQAAANESTISDNEEKIEENNRIIEEAEIIKAAREDFKSQLPQLENKIEYSLNIVEPCTANHSVLWSIIEANESEIRHWEETDSCDDTDWEDWWEQSADDIITTLVKELNTAKDLFKEHFNSDPDNPEEKIPWMNILTQDRPIDSPRYISFQGIWEHVIKLIYPDIFKVEVYKTEWKNLKLKKTSPVKSKNEIYKALVSYFNNKVDEYNSILEKEYNSAKTMNTYYTYIYKVDKLWTPTKDKSVRPYWKFTYDEMIKVIWWDEMLYTLAELLYYQSVSNNLREYFDNIWEDINETRETFDINKKISYVMEEYLKEDNDKIYRWEEIEGKDIKWERKSYAWLVIPSYSTWWYEVWYINSNWADNVTTDEDDIDITLKWWTSATRSLTADDASNMGYNDKPSDDEASQDIKKDCWYDPNEALSLYDWSWFKWLACWLKAVAKKPITVKLYFQTNPTISSITEPLEESWDTYKQSFKTTIDWYEDVPKSSENMNERTHKIVTYTQVSRNDNKVSITWKTWSLNFLSFEDLWDIIVKVQSTWDNCLIINWKDTCQWPVSINKNPYKKWFSLDYKLGKSTIWNVVASVSLCSSSDNCWVRNMSLSVVPGPVAKFKIETTTDNKVLAWAYTLLNITAQDKDWNEISRTLEKYKVKVNKWSLFMNWGTNTEQEINDFHNSTMLYRAEKWSAWTVNVTVENEKWKVMGENTINIFPGELKVEKDNAEVSEIEYKITDEKYYNDNWTINTKKAIPLKVSLKYAWQTVKITSNVAFKSEKSLTKIMIAEESKDNQNNNKIKLREANSLLMENWELTIYLVPWYKAWEDEIIVTVPWLDEKKIKLKIKPWEMKSIGVTLEKDTIYPKETLKGEIELTDAWWNKIEETTTVSISSTTEKNIAPSENPSIAKGSQKFTLETTENDAWLQKISVKSKDWKIYTSKKFTVKNFFLSWAIESWLNIMYLNLFGNDWWNQRWYYSDNNKFSENIIQKSSKTLAVTTQLIAPSKIKETSIIFWKQWNIQNNWWLWLKITTQNNKLKVLVDNVWEFSIKDNIERVAAIKNNPSNEQIENTIKKENRKVIYLFNINDSYTFEQWVFKTTNWEVVRNIKDWITLERSNYNIGIFPVREAKYNWLSLANAIIANIDYSSIDWKSENIEYEIWEIYDKWSTSWKIKALLSTVNTLDNQYQWYDSIQNSDELDKYIWFRADFKNITLFAEWESVWESTIPFGSEFLINIWDPLLKNRDEVASKRWLWQVKYSEPWKAIFKVTDIDYNADWLRDIIVIYRDWSINLLKQYANKKFQDLWRLMISAEQINEVFVWDVDWNKYEDIIIKNWKDQLRVYTNEDWVFDVDWNIVCLNTNATNWKPNGYPSDFSWVLQLFIDDMDNDWRSDIITLDKKWYLKIVYWNGTKSRHSYLSKDVYSCDKNWLERQEWVTKIVKKFGIQLSTKWVSDESIVRREWLTYPSNEDLEKQILDGSLDPSQNKTELEEQGIYIDPDFLKKLESWEISEWDIDTIVKLSDQINTTEQAQKTSEAASIFVKNPFVWKYMNILEDENAAFITLYNAEKYNNLTNTKKINKPTKKYRDKNWWELEDWDEVEVTVSITTNWVKISEFFDKITWPWLVDRDPETWAPKDLTFITWTWTIIQWTEWYDYWIINWQWSSWIAWWWALQLRYTLKYYQDAPVYRVRIVRENPVINIATVANAEDEDITILRRDWLKYEEKNKDILIKNPFWTQLNIKDWLNNWEQWYININDIGSYITRTNSKEVYSMDKNYKDLNWWNLDNWDTVEVTVSIPLPKSHVNINAIFEDIKWPRNESWIPWNFEITKGNWTIKWWINWYDFYITNINPIANEDEYIFEYKYNLTYKDNWNNPNTDNLPSIIIQPVDWCVKMEEVLENAKTDKNRAYNTKIIDLQELANKYAEWKQAASDEATKTINDDIAWAKSNWTEWSIVLNSTKETYWVKDLLQDVWAQIWDNNWLDFWTIDLDITKALWVDLKKIEWNIQKFANSLCHWFTFWTEWWSKTCEWLPVPFNQAFLAPGNYHIMWCIPLEPLTRTLGNWLPIFHFPWTLWVPTPAWTIPIPIPRWLKSPSDDFLRVGWWFSGYPSMIRIYAAPTLTAQLWIAICVWPQKVWINLPSPVADIWWNCIVTAVALPCWWWDGSWWDDDDWNWEDEETFENWIWEYWETNECKPKESESPFTMVASPIMNTNTYPTSPNQGPYLWWAVSIDYDPISSDIGDWDSWIEINGVQIKWAKDAKNKLLWWLQQWIQKILINWIDRQIQYWINNLLRFEIEFTFPDISYLSEEINKIWSSNIDKATDEKKKEEDKKKAEDLSKKNKNSKKEILNLLKRVGTADVSREEVKKLNLAEWANPFKELQELFNNTELVKVSTQNINIRIPRIYSEDIEAYKNYLLTWYEDNSTTLNWWIASAEAAVANCKKESKTDPKKVAHCKAIEDAQAKLLKLTNKFDKIWPQIFQNVQTLEAYKRFPLQIYEWMHVTDKYLWDISALIGNFFWYINYWMDVNANRFTQYCDAIITIVTIVKTYQIMIDLFAEWWSKCWKCTQDTYDQYTCKLSFLCNAFEIPIIPIPSVKIPSIYVDLSSFNLQMKILLPRFSFKPESIELPRLPNLPQPPQLWVNFNIDFDIPDIPQLPQPPELPELPNFIPQVKMELPILPPAPEIPEIPNKITWLLSLAKTLSKIFCIIKSWIGLVWESAVKARIEQMTQRSYEVPRVDNLDLTMFFKEAPLQWIDIEVDSFVNLQYNFDAFYALLKSMVDPLNEASYSLLQNAQNWVNYLDEKTSDLSDKLDRTTNTTVLIKAEISKANNTSKMKEQLYELRDSLWKIKDKERVNEVLAYASTDTKVEKNEKEIKKIEEELNKLITSEKENINQIAELAKNDYDEFLKTIENRKEKSLQLTFATNLLNKNSKAEKAIEWINATEMFIDTENKKVNWYYSALKNHTASELNMTEETYDKSIKYMASIKDTINQWYSIKRTEYAGTTMLSDNNWNSEYRTLLTATNNTTPITNEASTTDYSQYVNWIFIKDWDKTINAVNSEYNYNKFIWYYEKDLDKDWKNELLMWDNYNVFIKYFDKWNNTKGKKAIVIKPTLKEWLKKQYLSAGWLFSNQIKVYDENSEVKNFELKWQNYDSISFSWDNNEYEAISWYLMRIIERVDWFREKNSQDKIKYILFLPNWTEEELDDKWIQLEQGGTTQKIKNLLWKTIYEVKFYNPALANLQFNLPEVPRKWEYVQVTTLKLDNIRYVQNAPWSNQLVWWRQAIADAEPPKATVELERVKKNNEVVDEWFDLEWYVGTYYNLKITRSDETKVRQTKLFEKDEKNNTGKLLHEKDFDKFSWIIILPDLFFTKTQVKEYTIYAVDSQWNETEETIKLQILVPWISIENIERLEWYKEWIKNPVSITSELEIDIDKWDVSFERFRNNSTTPISATEWWWGKLTYPVTTNQTKVTWQYYDYWDAIGLYSKDNKQIANLNWANWEIELKPEYKWKVTERIDLSQGFPVIKIIEGDNQLFEIIIQPEKLIKTEVYQWSLINLEWNNYWMFNWGQAIMKDNKPILYIAPTGTIYTTENLQWDYIFNKSDETITYKIYETFGSEIASITFKAKPLE